MIASAASPARIAVGLTLVSILATSTAAAQVGARLEVLGGPPWGGELPVVLDGAARARLPAADPGAGSVLPEGLLNDGELRAGRLLEASPGPTLPRLTLLRLTDPQPAGFAAADRAVEAAVLRTPWLASGVGRVDLRAMQVVGSERLDGTAGERSGGAWSIGFDADLLRERVRIGGEYVWSRSDDADGEGRATGRGYRLQAGAALLPERDLLGSRAAASATIEHASTGASFFSPANPDVARGTRWTEGSAEFRWGALEITSRLRMEREKPEAAMQDGDGASEARRFTTTAEVAPAPLLGGVAGGWSRIFDGASVGVRVTGERSREGEDVEAEARALETFLRFQHGDLDLELSHSVTDEEEGSGPEGIRRRGAALSASIPVAGALSLAPRLEWERAVDGGTGLESRVGRASLEARVSRILDRFEGSASVELGRERDGRGALSERTLEAKVGLGLTIPAPRSRAPDLRLSLEGDYRREAVPGESEESSFNLLLRGELRWHGR